MDESDFYQTFDGYKSTDDFYTYNSRDFDERVSQDVLTIELPETDNYDMITEWD